MTQETLFVEDVGLGFVLRMEGATAKKRKTSVDFAENRARIKFLIQSTGLEKKFPIPMKGLAKELGCALVSLDGSTG